MKKLVAAGMPILAGLVLASWPAHAWDYEVHRFINQLALASLPTNFPAFVRASEARERIAFLGGEPDRWRNTPDLPLRHANGPDHYLDLEDLAKFGLNPDQLSPFRHVFTAQLTRGRQAHPENFPAGASGKDLDATRDLVGFLPWTITEYQGKLKSAFSYLRELEAAGTADEIANARQNVIYLMGVMGHFVGDATQPLHTTKHYNGWAGPNPKGYTTSRTFHAWIDYGFLRVAGVKTNEVFARVRPARLPWPAAPCAAQTNCFPEMLAFVIAQSRLVEPLYELEKHGHLAQDAKDLEPGRAFLTDQLLKAAQMLGDLWLAAWQQAPPDPYLQGELARRKKAVNGSGRPAAGN